ncbi:hypothetical protein DTO271D3_1703 [Paecilomyces variotii]|nr:hypothetical protein DTO169E5_8552 [Paecilomyces variotii]KAJ9317998.1 hypothetical protein DTO271D3_1703 [Paecilomyces variotii]KAJ9359301.1 hypothetical protein DTO280E4_4806 [Paecilomyces variotii]
MSKGFCARTKRTPLLRASFQYGSEGLVQLLLNYGADVNGKPHPSGGRTALQAATEYGRKSVVKTLWTFGAKIKAERASKDGISAVEAAASISDQEILQLFRDKEPEIISSDPIAKSREQLLNVSHPLHRRYQSFNLQSKIIATTTERFSVYFLQALPNHRWETNHPLCLTGHSIRGRSVTALQTAVCKRDIDVVQLLLENDADINAPAAKNGRRTALQVAVSKNHLAMTKLLAASSGFAQLTEFLLSHGADVNAPAAHFGGVTALQGAALQGNVRIIMVLLQAGADINGAPAIEQERNAIEGAAENGRLDTLHLLLIYHPNTEEFEVKKKRAAELALANGHLAIGRFLLAYRKSG